MRASCRLVRSPCSDAQQAATRGGEAFPGEAALGVLSAGPACHRDRSPPSTHQLQEAMDGLGLPFPEQNFPEAQHCPRIRAATIATARPGAPPSTATFCPRPTRSHWTAKSPIPPSSPRRGLPGRRLLHPPITRVPGASRPPQAPELGPQPQPQPRPMSRVRAPPSVLHLYYSALGS